MSEFLFPLSETYVAFGDGSSNVAGSFYGLVLIPESSIADLELKIQAVKTSYGGQNDHTVHCRELFNEHARAKSCWSHLSYEDVISLCGSIMEAVAGFDPKYLIAHIPKSHYPKRFRLKGKGGHPDLVHDVDEKWLQLWAFFRLGGLLDPCERIVPDDPKIIPRPKNRPYWNMLIRRSDPGMRVKIIYLDREETKIRWLSKSLQWISVAKELVVENQDGESYLPIEHASSNKPLLLDIADILTYSLAREFSGVNQIDYSRYCGEVLVEILPKYGEEIIVGG